MSGCCNDVFNFTKLSVREDWGEFVFVGLGFFLGL